MMACFMLAPAQAHRALKAPGAAARRPRTAAAALPRHPERLTWHGSLTRPPRVRGAAAASAPSAGGSFWPPKGGQDDAEVAVPPVDVPDVTLATLARQVSPPMWL